MKTVFSAARALALPLVVIGGLAASSATPAFADQPRMHKALDLLRAARAELQGAAANKGGHRVKAIEAVDRAINQVKAGIESARN